MDRKQLVFILPVQAAAVEALYLSGAPPNLTEESTSTTPLQQLGFTSMHGLFSADSNEQTFSFLDESHKFVLTMQDSVKQQVLRGSVCFWCHHGFGTAPIGVPLTYRHPHLTRAFTSNNTRETYTLKHQITRQTLAEIEPETAPSKCVYETEGVFCSFQCALAYVHEHSAHPRMLHAEFLLRKMRNDAFGGACADKPLRPAPHWTLIDCYGGPLTIDAFRASTEHYRYAQLDQTLVMHPMQMPRGQLFEQIYMF